MAFLWFVEFRFFSQSSLKLNTGRYIFKTMDWFDLINVCFLYFNFSLDKTIDEDVCKKEERLMVEEINELLNDRSPFVALAAAISLYSINHTNQQVSVFVCCYFFFQDILFSSEVELSLLNFTLRLSITRIFFISNQFIGKNFKQFF